MPLTDSSRYVVDRRAFLQTSLSAAGSIFPGLLSSSRASAPNQEPKIALVHEFSRSWLMGVDSDGSELCLGNGSSSFWSYRLDRHRWGLSPVVAQQLRLVEIHSWKTLRSVAVEGLPFGEFLFSADGKMLCGALLSEDAKSPSLFVDLTSGQTRTFKDEESSSSYIPLSAGIVLKISQSTLTRLDFTGSKILATVSLPPTDGRTEKRFPPLCVCSPLAATLICAVPERVTCRSTETLAVLWERNVESFDGTPDYRNGVSVERGIGYVVSADGSVVAAHAAHNYGGERGPTVIHILSGRSGVLITSWEVEQVVAPSLSPDGQLIAIGTIVADEMTDYCMPTIVLYETRTGKRLGSITHDRVSPTTDHQRLHAGDIRISFLDGGKYLVTSANDKVKVWRLPTNWVAVRLG